MVILKLKAINFTAMRLLFFGGDVDIEKVLVSNNISFGEKVYKYLFGYLHGKHELKPLYVMLLKTSAYIKS